MPAADPPVPIMVGPGWFPDRLGGLERYLTSFHDAWRAAGHDARTVVLGPVAVPPAGMTIPAAGSDGIRRRMTRMAAAVAAWRSEGDLVDCHFAEYGLLPTLMRRILRLPMVVHFHGPWAEEEMLHGRLPARRVALARAMERVVYRNASALVTLSAAFADLVAADYGVERARVHVIPPGVDLERFCPTDDKAGVRRALGVPVTGFLAVTVRRLVPRTGVDVLLSAWQAMTGDRLLVVVGDGPSRPALEDQVRNGGDPSTVHFAGRVADDSLPLWMQAADVVVMPSLALEGFGLVALEALACGTPVIGTAVGGLPEALLPLDTSLVVPPGDSAALAARLERARSGDHPLPGALACRATAERYTWAAAVESHAALYSAALLEKTDLRPSRRRRRVTGSIGRRRGGGR